jgi:hypothetical protein
VNPYRHGDSGREWQTAFSGIRVERAERLGVTPIVCRIPVSCGGWKKNAMCRYQIYMSLRWTPCEEMSLKTLFAALLAAGSFRWVMASNRGLPDRRIALDA